MRHREPSDVAVMAARVARAYPTLSPYASARIATRYLQGQAARRKGIGGGMSMRQFIREHRDELDAIIRAARKRPNAKLNDEERLQWIANDEGLYLWARREGVQV